MVNTLSKNQLFMWAGGKSKMMPKYAPLFSDAIRFLPLVEPFVGGGAMFNSLVSEPRKSVIADINAELIGLYRLVQKDPAYLIAQMADLEQRWMPLAGPERKEFYYALRRKYWLAAAGHEKTALLYFLMKTCFNGIWQTSKEAGGQFGTAAGLTNKTGRVFSP